MKDVTKNLNKRVYVRMNQKDYNKLMSKYSTSTCRKLSEFIGNVLFNKPITIKQRNQSLDDFMTEMIMLRNELNAIGININQSVRKLHSMEQIFEIKNCGILGEIFKKELDEKVEEIKNKINLISDIWLQ